MLPKLSFILIICIIPQLITSNSNLPNNFLMYNSKMDLYSDFLPIQVNDLLYCSINSISPPATSELKTESGAPYQYILAPSEGCINFEVRTSDVLNISLNSDMVTNPPIYKIILGGWSNSKSAIYSNDDFVYTIVNTPGIISNYQYRGYWIRWNTNVVRIGLQGNSRNVIVFNYPNKSKINYIGFAGQGIGYWNIRNPESSCFSERITYVKAACSL